MHWEFELYNHRSSLSRAEVQINRNDSNKSLFISTFCLISKFFLTYISKIPNILYFISHTLDTSLYWHLIWMWWQATSRWGYILLSKASMITILLSLNLAHFNCIWLSMEESRHTVPKVYATCELRVKWNS